MEEGAEVPTGAPLAFICEDADDAEAARKALTDGRDPADLADRDAVWQAFGTEPSARGCI